MKFFLSIMTLVSAGNNVGSDLEQKDFTMNNKDPRIDPRRSPCFNASQLGKES
jgi:hypothetical protein